MVENKYYTKEEVMKLLNKPSTSFQREVNAGTIPSEIEEGRKRGRRFPKEAIDAYISLLKQGSQEKFEFEPSTNSDLWATVENSRRIYGEEDSLSFKRALEWKELNDEIYMSAKEGEKLIGGVTIVPLAESTIHALVNDKIREKDIPNWAIKKWSDSELSAYIATIAIVPSGDKKADNARGRFLIRQTVRWAISLYKQYDIKNWYGIALTHEGEKLLQHLGFKLIPNRARKGYILESITKSTGLFKDFLEKIEAEGENISMPR